MYLMKQDQFPASIPVSESGSTDQDKEHTIQCHIDSVFWRCHKVYGECVFPVFIRQVTMRAVICRQLIGETDTIILFVI